MSETQPTRPSPTPKTVKDVAEIASDSAIIPRGLEEMLKSKSCMIAYGIRHYTPTTIAEIVTESTAELQQRCDRLKEQLAELTKLPMPLPSDPTTPFYKETMEQAKQLREMATRTGDIQADRLERISRKLNYMNDAFTCTANFVPMQLEVHELKKQIVELRRQMDKPIQ